jgi:hypothetical protein
MWGRRSAHHSIDRRRTDPLPIDREPSITQDEGGAVAARQHHVTTITDAGEGRPRTQRRQACSVAQAQNACSATSRTRRSGRRGGHRAPNPEPACSATSGRAAPLAAGARRPRTQNRRARRRQGRVASLVPRGAGCAVVDVACARRWIAIATGGSHPVTGRQALHREADDLLRSQLDAKSELGRLRDASAFEGRSRDERPGAVRRALHARVVLVAANDELAAPCIASFAGARRRGKW